MYSVRNRLHARTRGMAFLPIGSSRGTRQSQDRHRHPISTVIAGAIGLDLARNPPSRGHERLRGRMPYQHSDGATATPGNPRERDGSRRFSLPADGCDQLIMRAPDGVARRVLRRSSPTNLPVNTLNCIYNFLGYRVRSPNQSPIVPRNEAR